MENSHIEQISNKQSSVLTFIGTTPNIGTTIAALQHSFHIVDYTMSSVLVICMNLKSSKLHHFFGISNTHPTLDDVLPHLKNKQLNTEGLIEILYRPTPKRELYILLGNKQRELAEQFMDEDLFYLIALAKDKFDYIVIDTSSYWDTAGSFVALQAASHIVVVTTDARSHFQEDYQKWFGALSSYIALSLEKLYLLVLRQPATTPHYSYRDIVAETGATPYVDTALPISIYGYLDRGELLDWLLHHREESDWLAESCHLLINPIHISQLPPTSTTTSKYYWPWQRKSKCSTSLKLGG